MDVSAAWLPRGHFLFIHSPWLRRKAIKGTYPAGGLSRRGILHPWHSTRVRNCFVDRQAQVLTNRRGIKDAGLTALKLPSCYSTDPLHPNCDPVCPVCDGRLLGTLAKEVPWSHHPNSSIICRISGKTVDEDNPPMCFPNTGNVYSRAALLEMAQKRGDMTVVDPRSGDVVHFDSLKKVFIT